MELKSYTMEEVAKYLQLDVKTVRSEIEKGNIPRIKGLWNIRIPASYLDMCELGDYETGSFAEKKLRRIIEEKDQEIEKLKNTIRTIVQTGMEIKF